MSNNSSQQGKPIVFFVRCKPQGADIIELVKTHNRVFLGYAEFKNTGSLTQNIQDQVYNISSLTTDEHKEIADNNNGVFPTNLTKNIQLVNEAVRDSYVLIPRPEDGEYYLGKVAGYSLQYDAKIVEEYRELRNKQTGINKRQSDWEKPLSSGESDGGKSHWKDVIQSFTVTKLISLPTSAVPGWIRRSMFGRSTSGRIKDLELDSQTKHRANPLDWEAYAVMDLLYRENKLPVSSSLEVELFRFLTPNIFEHFMCDLFAREFVESRWMHVGGSGDGGVDFIGYDRDSGKITAKAQCKLKPQSKEEIIAELNNLKPNDGTLKLFICNFYYVAQPDEDPRIYDRRRIIELFEKHTDSMYWKMINYPMKQTTENTISLAIAYMMKQHGADTRKGSTIPYFTHPLGVMNILLEEQAFDTTISDDVILAGLFHDLNEDANVSIATLKENYGAEVARLVENVSEPEELKKDPNAAGTWRARKEHSIHLIESADKFTKYLTCADKLDNARSMRRDIVSGIDVWKKFNAPKSEILWYYQSILHALTIGDSIEQSRMYHLLEIEIETVFTT